MYYSSLPWQRCWKDCSPPNRPAPPVTAPLRLARLRGFQCVASRMNFLLLAFFQRDLISIGKSNFLQIAIFRAIDSCHHHDGYGLTDSRGEISAVYPDFGKP